MRFVTVKKFSHFQKCQLLDLWHKEYPANLHYENMHSFGAYLDKIDGSVHTLLVDEDDSIKGWLAVIIRDDKDWIALIIDSSIQSQGYGSQLLNQVKNNSEEIYAWVVDHNNYKMSNGEAYKSPLDFYLKNDFEVIESERLEQDNLSAVKIQWRKQ